MTVTGPMMPVSILLESVCCLPIDEDRGCTRRVDYRMSKGRWRGVIGEVFVDSFCDYEELKELKPSVVQFLN